MTIDEKQVVMDTIRESVPVFKKRTQIQYSIRCPYCGDSKKNINDSHCYIKWSTDESEPLLFKCFLCNTSGIVDKRFMELLGVEKDLSSILDRQKYNKMRSLKQNNINIVTGTPIMDSLQTRYIEHRLGQGFTFNDYNKFRIVWDIGNLLPYISSERIKNTLPSNTNSISFLTDDKTVLLTRLFKDDGEIRWKKVRLIPSDYGKSYYMIETTLNLFTEDTITVNMAEGIIDILSVYKNFNDGENHIFLAVLGSDYLGAIEYITLRGLIGTNVIVKIYIDDDQNENFLIQRLKRYKWLFKNIYVYRNLIDKDVGVTIELSPELESQLVL